MKKLNPQKNKFKCHDGKYLLAVEMDLLILRLIELLAEFRSDQLIGRHERFFPGASYGKQADLEAKRLFSEKRRPTFAHLQRLLKPKRKHSSRRGCQ